MQSVPAVAIRRRSDTKCTYSCYTEKVRCKVYLQSLRRRSDAKCTWSHWGKQRGFADLHFYLESLKRLWRSPNLQFISGFFGGIKGLMVIPCNPVGGQSDRSNRSYTWSRQEGCAGARRHSAVAGVPRWSSPAAGAPGRSSLARTSSGTSAAGSTHTAAQVHIVVRTSSETSAAGSTHTAAQGVIITLHVQGS